MCAPHAHGIERQFFETRGHVTCQDVIGRRPARVRRAHPCLPRARIHVCAPRTLAVEGRFSKPLGHVTWYGGGASCLGRHRQRARADAGNSSVPSACEDPRLCSAHPCRRGSDLRDPWSRYSGWRRAVVPGTETPSAAGPRGCRELLCAFRALGSMRVRRAPTDMRSDSWAPWSRYAGSAYLRPAERLRCLSLVC